MPFPVSKAQVQEQLVTSSYTVMHDSTSNVVVLLLAKHGSVLTFMHRTAVAANFHLKIQPETPASDIPDWCCHNSLDDILSLS